MAGPVIRLENVARLYRLGDEEVQALRGVSLSFYPGDMLSVMGPSGSGKSTLMNILGCLDRPTSGSYWLDGEEVGQLKDSRLAAIRNRKIGFVFQTFNLLARTTALANCELPLIYSGMGQRERRERATAALAQVGLGERMHHRPNELSGGQQQRVAIARALINRPAIILADEPTGNLDSKSGVEILRLLQQLNQQQGITVLIVTHDPFVARHTQRIVRVHDGQIVGDDAVAQPLVAGEAVRPSDAALAATV
ncbi:MAG: ABC transporter ATP-binding protein [Chloroflexi bacterium]|nr:ABC transporter ATP-binding protein [Chloroflexota bacterium]